MQDFIHYSAQPLIAVHSTEQCGPMEYMKPTGLWFSVEPDDGWLEWCDANEFNLGNFEHAARIHLARQANVLRISNAAELLDFHNRFKTELFPAIRMTGIDWRAVAARYQGIVIAPYIWSMLLDMETLWYYGWDCASGCIWDAGAVAKIERLTEFRKPRVREDEDAA